VRIRHSIASIAVAAGLLSVALSGCGSSSSGNGVQSKSPEAIVSAATQALKGVRSVHVYGSTTTSGKPIKLNLLLVSGKGGRGEITQNGLSFQVISTAGQVYINGSDGFWRHFGGEAAVQLFHGKWLKAPATGELASVADLTNLQQLFGKLLSSHGTLKKGASTTVNGQKVIALEDATQGGTLYVATTGSAYPIEVTKTTGSEGGTLNFDRYNESVSLSAPANAVNISQLH
jgi:hypothetical protein